MWWKMKTNSTNACSINRWVCLVIHDFKNFFTTVQLYCSIGIWPMGNLGRFPLGKAAVIESHYPTYDAYWVFYCFHNPLNSDMGYRIFKVHADVNACNCTQGLYRHCKRVCTERWLWEKNLFPHWAIESASAACRSNTIPPELHPCPTSVTVQSDVCSTMQ